jgi:hypothetical protein
MRTKLLATWEKLSFELIISPPRKKFKNISRSQILDLEEDEEQTYSSKMGGGDGKELQAIITHGNLEEKLGRNLDHLIINILIELIQHVVPIVEFKQLIVAIAKLS